MPSQEWVTWEIRELFTTGMLDISNSCILRNDYSDLRYNLSFLFKQITMRRERKRREAEVQSDLQSEAEEQGRKKARRKM